jgi:magnesium transporter
MDHDDKLQGSYKYARSSHGKSESHLNDIMVTQIIGIEEADTINDAKEKFSRY